MKVLQNSDLINEGLKQIVGEAENGTALDYANAIAKGRAMLTSPDDTDGWLQTMLDRINKTIITNRPYENLLASYVMSDAEWGSIVQKLTCIAGEFTSNDTWGQSDGSTIDQFKIYKPTVLQKVFNQIDTWELPLTIARRQLQSCFDSESGYNAFWAGVNTDVTTKKENAKQLMAQIALCNFIVDHVSSDNNAKVKKINLLHEYNTATNKTLTVTTALHDADFLRFAALQIQLWSDRMSMATKLFNHDGLLKHTSKDMQRLVLISEFAKSLEYNMEADTYHNEIVKIGDHIELPSWLGQDDTFSFKSCTKVQRKQSGEEEADQTVNGVVGILHDRYALGITVLNERVTSSPYNAKGEYYNYFNKADIGYFNDQSENAVVFTMEEV